MNGKVVEAVARQVEPEDWYWSPTSVRPPTEPPLLKPCGHRSSFTVTVETPTYPVTSYEPTS